MRTFIRAAKATLIFIASLAFVVGLIWLLSVTVDPFKFLGFCLFAVWASCILFAFAFLWKMLYDEMK